MASAAKSKAGPRSVLWALFSLKGRIRRVTYLLGIALIFTVWWFGVAQMLAIPEGSERYETWALLVGFTVIASSYCLYALAHKRLHDLGMPGYVALLVTPVVFNLPALLLLPLILLAGFPGQPDANSYGPPPVETPKA